MYLNPNMCTLGVILKMQRITKNNHLLHGLGPRTREVPVNDCIHNEIILEAFGLLDLFSIEVSAK